MIVKFKRWATGKNCIYLKSLSRILLMVRRTMTKNNPPRILLEDTRSFPDIKRVRAMINVGIIVNVANSAFSCIPWLPEITSIQLQELSFRRNFPAHNIREANKEQPFRKFCDFSLEFGVFPEPQSIPPPERLFLPNFPATPVGYQAKSGQHFCQQPFFGQF